MKRSKGQGGEVVFGTGHDRGQEKKVLTQTRSQDNRPMHPPGTGGCMEPVGDSDLGCVKVSEGPRPPTSPALPEGRDKMQASDCILRTQEGTDFCLQKSAGWG